MAYHHSNPQWPCSTDGHEEASVAEKAQTFRNSNTLGRRRGEHILGVLEARRLLLELGSDNNSIEWVAVRPDTLREGDVSDYAVHDELVDSPVEMGTFWLGEFSACGVPHRFVVSGAPASFDGERLLADARKICEAEIRFWHGRGKPPHDQYLFLLNAVDDGYGGLEHHNSTALICGRRDLPRLGEPKASEGYTTLLGLISHEYFHTWNVKRIKPAAFVPYDLERENYTTLLWLFEGLTSYSVVLALARSGLVTREQYLETAHACKDQGILGVAFHLPGRGEAAGCPFGPDIAGQHRPTVMDTRHPARLH